MKPIKTIGITGLFLFIMNLLSMFRKKKRVNKDCYTPKSSGRDSITYTPNDSPYSGFNRDIDREPGTKDWVEDGSG